LEEPFGTAFAYLYRAMRVRRVLLWSLSLFSIFAISLAISVPGFGASQNNKPSRRLYILKSIDVDHPFCPSDIDLSVASEYFVPVANDLPGLQDYNAAVREYRKRSWESLKTDLDRFRKIYENSPLLEAVTFLQAESQIEQAMGNNDDMAIREAEKAVREALLLYPNSDLGPVVSSELANYWLRHNNFQKSLALFKLNRETYPFHPLACVFQMGIAESAYRTGQPGEAEPSFKQLLQKCQNERLRTGAEIRLAELAWTKAEEGSNRSISAGIKKQLESVYSAHFALIPRHYPALLANLGELEYEEKKYDRAKFFFQEFASAVGKKNEFVGCLASMHKRMSDIAFRSNQPIESVEGEYLSVKQEYPESDMGIVSEIIGLTLDFTYQSIPERTRRISVIDDEIDQIKNEKLRSFAYLQKGLALLEAGEEKAIPYLIRLDEKTAYSLTKGNLGGFVRDNVLAMLNKKLHEAKSADNDDGVDKETVELLPSIASWLKDSRLDAKGNELYTDWQMTRIENNLKTSKIDAALDNMVEWQKSGMFPARGVNPVSRRKLSEDLIRNLFQSPEPTVLAVKLLKNRDVITPFVDPKMPGLWVVLALKAGDDQLITKLIGENLRAPSSFSNNMPDDVKNYLAMAVGQSLAKMKRFNEADGQLTKVKDPSLIPQATNFRMNMMKDLKRYNQAFEIGFSAANQYPATDRKALLGELSQIAYDGKIWKRAPDLLHYSIKNGISGKELAPFRYLAARSFFEKHDFKLAAQEYENALLLDPAAADSAEARYRLGKALVKIRRPQEAIKVWQDLANQKDPFWSPLASNEIKTMK
jgi:tetratricopeptide (TPR) repeat protein